MLIFQKKLIPEKDVQDSQVTMNHERCDKVVTQASNEIKDCTFDAAYY